MLNILGYYKYMSIWSKVNITRKIGRSSKIFIFDHGFSSQIRCPYNLILVSSIQRNYKKMEIY